MSLHSNKEHLHRLRSNPIDCRYVSTRPIIRHTTREAYFGLTRDRQVSRVLTKNDMQDPQGQRDQVGASFMPNRSATAGPRGGVSGNGRDSRVYCWPFVLGVTPVAFWQKSSLVSLLLPPPPSPKPPGAGLLPGGNSGACPLFDRTASRPIKSPRETATGRIKSARLHIAPRPMVSLDMRSS